MTISIACSCCANVNVALLSYEMSPFPPVVTFALHPSTLYNFYIWLHVTSPCRLLTALDDDMDEATESMNFVMGRLGKLLKTKSESCNSVTNISVFET